jgi:prevent-host-death family protein
MPLSLTEDVKTVSEVKKNLRAVLEQVRDTGRPVVVTVNGKPDAVLIDVETYERKLKSLNLVCLLAEGEQDVRQGRTRRASAFLKELKRAKKIPS